MAIDYYQNEQILTSCMADKVAVIGTRASSGNFIVTDERIFYKNRFLPVEEYQYRDLSGYKTWKVLGIMATGFTLVTKKGKEIKYASMFRKKIIEALKLKLPEIK